MAILAYGGALTAATAVPAASAGTVLPDTSPNYPHPTAWGVATYVIQGRGTWVDSFQGGLTNVVGDSPIVAHIAVWGPQGSNSFYGATSLVVMPCSLEDWSMPNPGQPQLGYRRPGMYYVEYKITGWISGPNGTVLPYTEILEWGYMVEP